jgi:hypothetical protein
MVNKRSRTNGSMSTASKLVTPGCGSLHRPDNLNNIPDTANAAHHATANTTHPQIGTPNRKNNKHTVDATHIVVGHALRHPHRGGARVVAQHVEHPGLRLVNHRQRLSGLACDNIKHTVERQQQFIRLYATSECQLAHEFH